MITSRLKLYRLIEISKNLKLIDVVIQLILNSFFNEIIKNEFFFYLTRVNEREMTLLKNVNRRNHLLNLKFFDDYSINF